MKKKIIVLVVVVLLFTSIFFVFLRKPRIMHAERSDIVAIDGFGVVLTERTMIYIRKHPYCDIDDLMNVNGIGEERLLLLKEKFR